MFYGKQKIGLGKSASLRGTFFALVSLLKVLVQLIFQCEKFSSESFEIGHEKESEQYATRFYGG
jgi:hypothetical protein